MTSPPPTREAQALPAIEAQALPTNETQALPTIKTPVQTCYGHTRLMCLHREVTSKPGPGPYSMRDFDAPRTFSIVRATAFHTKLGKHRTCTVHIDTNDLLGYGCAKADRCVATGRMRCVRALVYDATQWYVEPWFIIERVCEPPAVIHQPTCPQYRAPVIIDTTIDEDTSDESDHQMAEIDSSDDDLFMNLAEMSDDDDDDDIM